MRIGRRLRRRRRGNAEFPAFIRFSDEAAAGGLFYLRQKMRKVVYAVAVKCLLSFALLFVTSYVSAQGAQPRLVAEVNLESLGVAIPGASEVSRHAMELLFLSDSRIVMFDSIAPNYTNDSPLTLAGDRRFISVDASRGAIVQTIALEPKEWGDARQWAQLQRISDDEFAIAHTTGMMFCNAGLECKQGAPLVGTFQFAPNGSHFVISSATQGDRRWADYSRELKPLGSYAEGAFSQILVANKGVFFVSPSQLRFYATAGASAVNLRSDASPASLALAGSDGVAYLRGNKHELAVVRSNGSEPYQVNLRSLPAMPWNTHLVSSADGRLFGAEWTANTKLQLINPFACIDECPVPGLQYFAVFSANDGKLVASFEWDPRPWNMYVVPALSPDGTLTALVQGSTLKIYALR